MTLFDFSRVFILLAVTERDAGGRLQGSHLSFANYC